ncbi:MAG: hypothetical protein RR340_02350 [Cloacibacillus sp.]
MDNKRIEELKFIAQEVQKDVLRMVGLARSGPFETSMAAANLLVYLYWEELLLVPETPRREDRDRFVMDLPAAVPALYAVLARRGYFEREHLWHYRRLGAMLQALPDYRRTPGIDAPCVTAEPALAMASALAGALRRGADSPRVVIMTDESAFPSKVFAEELRFAGRAFASNLIMIALSRKADAGSRCENEKLLGSCGWQTRTANSEDWLSLEAAFSSFDYSAAAPKALLVFANAELGLFVTDAAKRSPAHVLSMGELDQALEELEVKSNER